MTNDLTQNAAFSHANPSTQAVFDLLDREYDRQQEGVELIASENFVSDSVLRAMGSSLTNKYAEGLPGKRYYGGCEVVDQVEDLARDRAKQLFGASWVNVQPHSGAQANAAVMLATIKPGDSILGFDLAHGGHLTHGSPVNFSGKYFQAHFYGVEKETGRIDFDKLRDNARQVKPKLLICGASSYSRDWDYATLRSIADELGATLLADISHPSGLIATGLLNDPLKYCHVVTTTTHKTLRGPRGGMILVGQDSPNPLGQTTSKGKVRNLSSVLDSGVFPGTQGGPLMHVIAAKAVAFGEALEPDFRNYTQRVVANAQTLAQAMVDKGYAIISGGTDNHLMLVDLQAKGVTGKVAEEALGLAGITVNKNMVPFDPQPPMTTSGIRLGTAAMTSRGFGEAEMKQVAQWIDRALDKPSDPDHLAAVHNEVKELMKQFPLPYARHTSAQPA